MSPQHSPFHKGMGWGSEMRHPPLTKAALGFLSDMGLSGTILGMVGQLSPAPRASIISLSSDVILKTTILPTGAKGHLLKC